MADYQRVPQTPCIENMVQQWAFVAAVRKFRLHNIKLPVQVSSELIQNSIQTHIHCRIIFKQIEGTEYEEANCIHQAQFIGH